MLRKKRKKSIALLNAALNENNNSLSNVKKYIDELSFLINDLSLTTRRSRIKKMDIKIILSIKKFS